MPEDKTIQIKCSKEFKNKVEEAAKKDHRSVSNYGFIAIQNKMNMDEFKGSKSCSNCGNLIDGNCGKYSCGGSFHLWVPRNQEG